MLRNLEYFDPSESEGTIWPEDLDLFQYVETAEAAWAVIQKGQ